MEKNKFRTALLIESDTPIQMKNINAGDIINSIIVNGDAGGNIDNSEKGECSKESEDKKCRKNDKSKKGELKNPCGKKNPSNAIPAWAWILISSICGAIIFILAMILFQKWLDFEIDYENSATTIVLAFVGIAATFVVVSNYAQVKDVKDSHNTEIAKIQTNLSDFKKEYLEETKENNETCKLIEKQMNLYINDIHGNLRFIEAISFFNEEDYRKSLFNFLLSLDSISENVGIPTKDAGYIFDCYRKSNKVISWIDSVKKKHKDGWDGVLNEENISEVINRIKGKEAYSFIRNQFEDAISIQNNESVENL